MKLKKIIIYDEPSIPEIKISNLVNFLKDIFSADIIIKDNFFQKLDESEINLLSKTRIFDIYKKYSKYVPKEETITLERELCKNSSLMENSAYLS